MTENSTLQAMSDAANASKEYGAKGLSFFNSQMKSEGKLYITPYNDKLDCLVTLASPLIAPVALTVVTGLAAITAALAAITSVGTLCLAIGAGVASPFNKDAKELAEVCAVASLVTGVAAIAAALLTAVCAVLTAIAIPLALARIVTRSVATLVDKVSDLFSSEEEESSSLSCCC